MKPFVAWIPLLCWIIVVGPPRPAPPLAAPPATISTAAVSTEAIPAVAVSTVAIPAAAYRWPLDGPARVVRAFDPPARPWLPGHRGVDVAAEPGAAVRAAGPGVVWHAGVVAGRGVVSVAHENGLRTTYEPVDVRVRPGDRVYAGHLLGRLAPGHPGCPVPACLHWGLRRGTAYLDPLALLGLARVRLLPTGAGQRPADVRAHHRGHAVALGRHPRLSSRSLSRPLSSRPLSPAVVPVAVPGRHPRAVIFGS
jgi:murein DD-endopeptidase MepM/ murein hydrolase activator NlpD